KAPRPVTHMSSSRSKASRAFERAVEHDRAWFRANPSQTRYRRRIRCGELPRHLRGLGIIEVVIERASPSVLVRSFIAAAGRVVASGLDDFNDAVAPNAPGRTINIDWNNHATVDYADITASDREYFAKHPDETEFWRSPLASELEAVEPAPSGFLWLTRVSRLTSNARQRELQLIPKK